jgi:hypothetical protein
MGNDPLFFNGRDCGASIRQGQEQHCIIFAWLCIHWPDTFHGTPRAYLTRKSNPKNARLILPFYPAGEAKQIHRGP